MATKGKKPLEYDYSGLEVGDSIDFDISKDAKAPTKINSSIYYYGKRRGQEYRSKRISQDLYRVTREH